MLLKAAAYTCTKYGREAGSSDSPMHIPLGSLTRAAFVTVTGFAGHREHLGISLSRAASIAANLYLQHQPDG